MTRSIRLERQAIAEGQVGSIKGYKLLIEAIDAVDMPNEIFVYRALMVDPFTGKQAAEFDHVAAPADLEETPINGVTESSKVWFRLSTLDVLYRDKIELEQHWRDLQEDVMYLVEQMNRLDKLTESEEVEIGDLSECRGSSSSSAPEPSSSSSEPEPSSSSSEPEPPLMLIGVETFWGD